MDFMAWKALHTASMCFVFVSLFLSPSACGSPALYGCDVALWADGWLPSFLASFHMKTASHLTFYRAKEGGNSGGVRGAGGGSWCWPQCRHSIIKPTLGGADERGVEQDEQNDCLLQGSTWRILNFFEDFVERIFRALEKQKCVEISYMWE